MDLWVAITLGVILSLGSFVYRTMYPRIVILSRDPESKTFVNAERRGLSECPQILYIRPNMSIYFGNAQYVYDHILDKAKERLQKGSLKFILIDMEAVNYTDATGSETIIRLIRALRKIGVEASFANISCDVYPLLENAGFDKIVEHELVFNSKGQSIIELFKRIDHDYCRKSCPYVVFQECLTVKEKKLEEKKTA